MLEEKRLKLYNPSYAKASSIRNLAFRYMHCLISSSIFLRNDAGMFLSNDFHILWASLAGIPLHPELYLADHMESQTILHGNQMIGIGAFVTLIANQFGVPLPRDPVFRNIHLEKWSLQKQEMPAFDHDEYYWKLHELNVFRLIGCLTHT